VNNSQTIEFDAPCCASVRECSARKLAIIGIRGRPRVLREINAVRCNRGITKKVKVYPSNEIIVATYYISNRGRVYIEILWKPEGLDESYAKLYTQQALGLYETVEAVDD
jgi:hypothetical protein